MRFDLVALAAFEKPSCPTLLPSIGQRPVNVGIERLVSTDGEVRDRQKDKLTHNHPSPCLRRAEEWIRLTGIMDGYARARELLLQAGVPATEADEAATWVSKTCLQTNPGTQALEDAACLVFLENEIGVFAAQHSEYPREKFIDILRKTWRKMSPRAHELALGLPLPPAIVALVREAVTVP